jgi:sulfatase maturation enzyme AslB (radical SAM superfamily)
MGTMTHTAGRIAFSTAADVALHSVRKNREETIIKLVDLMQKYMKDEKLDINYDTVRKMIGDKDCTLNHYINRLVDEVDPHVLKTTALNLGYEAFFYGTKTIRKKREEHQCNIPWLILMDPTSACNLHCTGCWAAEYGNRLNLSFDEMDSIVTQGKELGTYFYMFTGGEPLVRKDDLIKLCEKHNDCAFLAFTNGTLVDEKLCRQMQKIGNFYLAISIEGFEEVNDLRRGNGVYGKVINAMALHQKT